MLPGELRERLENTVELAHQQLNLSQNRYTHHYDKRAKVRKLKQGDLVLVLLPVDQNKLLMKWMGPYKVEAVMGQND